MKSFFWKFLVCIVPCLLALWVTINSLVKYQNGESGGFKLGPDLAGGTILVYEIDLKKGSAGKADTDPQTTILKLAEALKKRIDPNDLFNIVIRPAGTEGRIEIILPTGGPYRMRQSVLAWNDLLKELREDKDLKVYFERDPDAKIEVERGKFPELGDAIQNIASWSIWQDKLFKYDSSQAGFLLNDEALARLKIDGAFPQHKRADVEKILKALEPKKGTKVSSETAFAAEIQEAYKKYNESASEANKFVSRGAVLPVVVASVEGATERAWYRLKLQAAQDFPNALDFDLRRDAVKFDADAALARPENASEDKKKQILKDLEEAEKKIADLQVKFTELSKDPQRLRKFVDFAFPSILEQDKTQQKKLLEAWVKRRAWEELVLKIENNPDWKDLQLSLSHDALMRVLPDNFEQMITLVQSKGSIPGQAALTIVENLVGKQTPLIKDAPKTEVVYNFMKENYGPSLTELNGKIMAIVKSSDRFRFLSSEDVERIKEMVKRVGSLEFRILANSADDSEAIKDQKEYLTSKDNALIEMLKKRREIGEAPPVKTEEATQEGKEPIAKTYSVKLHADYKANLQYAWVELGPQERRSLYLDNINKDNPQFNAGYNYLTTRLEIPVELPESSADSKNKRLQGALFYARRTENRLMSKEERDEKKYDFFILTRKPEIINGREQKIGGDLIENSAVSMDINPAVEFSFNNRGAELFTNITRQNQPDSSGANTNLKRHLAIILDEMVVSAPTINSVIGARGQITGNFTRREVEDLVNVLRSGRLPATLKSDPVSENTMGATLGADTVFSGVVAVIAAFGAVVLFMIVYYRFAGLVASIALFANLILTVGFMTAVQATFTLPGLAGLVLMLGMAVDANVLIYERLREERERGASLSLAIRNGYDRAIPTIIDTHLSSIFTAIVLYIVGNDQLKGFGVSLTVGLVISLFTSLYMTRVLFDYWQAKGWLTKLNMMRLFARPNIDFMSIRRGMFAFTLIIAILGIVLFVARLPNDLDIDFVGGTAFGAVLNEEDATDFQGLKKLIDNKERLAIQGDAEIVKADPKEGTLVKVLYKGTTEPVTILFSPDSAPKTKELAKKRVQDLPDVAIEQIFLSTDAVQTGGKSQRFTIRTSEREPRLVQVSLQRLLAHDAAEVKSRLEIGRVQSMAIDTQGKETRIFFQREPDAGGKLKTYDELQKESSKPGEKSFKAYGSVGLFKTLFTRHLQEELKESDRKKLPVFDVAGEGESREDRSFHSMRLSFDTELSASVQEAIKQALKATEAEFSRPQPFRLEKFDSQLANETRERALWAVLASWGAILLYLWFRFGNWTFGLAAVLCLIHDLFFTLGAVALCHYFHGTWFGNMLGLEDFKINLPAVAALLTLVGFSVNDTIVVFDRIREVRGKNPILTAKMINDSINQTLSRTVLASLTAWLVVVVLYIWGGPGVHLFAFVMVVGVLVGTYSSIYIASPLLLLFGEGIDQEAPVAKTPAKA